MESTVEQISHAKLGTIMFYWKNIQFNLHRNNWGLQLSVEIMNQHYVMALIAG
jgi:hypothetical protein